MIRRPPRSTLFPTRRSSDLSLWAERIGQPAVQHQHPPLVTLKVPNRRGKEATRFDLELPCFFDRQESRDRKSTRLNSSHSQISYAVFCLKKKTRSHLHPWLH